MGAHPVASHPVAETRATRRSERTSQTSQAEQTDRHSGGRSSAFAVPGSDADASGFDALFAGLGSDDAGDAEERATDAPTARARRGARSARGGRAEAASPAPVSPADAFSGLGFASSVVAGSASAASVAVTPSAAVPSSAAVVPPAVVPPAVVEASVDVVPETASAASADAIPQPSFEASAPSLSAWADAASAPAATRRAATADRRDAAPERWRDAGRAVEPSPRRSTHADGRVAARPDRSRPAAVTPSPAASARRRRGAGRLVSVVAMSFAAMLAVATTIPSLSLLSPSDVQALALADTGGVGLDGQRVELNGDIVAQTVQREGYQTQTIDEYARAAGIRPEATFTNNPAGTIQWPFAVGVHIGDRFGYRSCAGCSSNHGGQDFNPGLGAEIQAIADGTVAMSTDSGGSLGVVMMIDHLIDGELVTSVYAHMEYDSRRFEQGDTVAVGDVIGTTGDTGMSTGPHLHFEIRLGGVDGTKVDPLEWLYANTN